MRFAPIRVLAVGVAALGVADPAASQDRAATGAPADDVADVKVSDKEGIKPYSAAVEGTFKPFGGRSIVRGRIPSRSKGSRRRGASSSSCSTAWTRPGPGTTRPPILKCED